MVGRDGIEPSTNWLKASCSSRKRIGGCCDGTKAPSKLTLVDAVTVLDNARVAQRLYEAVHRTSGERRLDREGDRPRAGALGGGDREGASRLGACSTIIVR